MKNAPKSHGYGGIVDFCLTLPAIARKKQETAGGFSAHPCYNKGIQTPEEGRTVSKTTLFDSRIKKYAYREAAQLYGELGSSPAGLSPEQVERQQEKYGSNCFGSRSSDTMLRRCGGRSSTPSTSFSLCWGAFRWWRMVFWPPIFPRTPPQPSLSFP